MSPSSLLSCKGIISLQIGAVLAAVVALALYPPRQGDMALIALDGRDAGRLARSATANGAMLLGRGPLSNILIVRGERSRITPALLTSGVLAIAAPKGWCGSGQPPP